MSFKMKKLDRKKKKEKDPNKFHLGNNSGTYLIILGALICVGFVVVILFMTLIGKDSYLQVYNNNRVYPYQDEDHQELIQNPTFYDAKDYKTFDISLTAKSFDTHDAHRADFNLSVCKNDASPECLPLRYLSNKFEYKTDSTYRLYASICLASDWVGVCNYSSSYSYITKSNFESTLEKTSPKSISVTLKTNEVFPMKTPNWPVPVTINTPDAYLLLAYFTFEKGVETLHFDVIHYTYKEFYVAGVTSPAI